MLADHPQRRAAILFGLSLACFAAYQQFKLPVVLPVLLERYGYERTLAGGFMSIYALVGLLFSLPVGRLIERYGPLRPVQAALALFGLAALIPLAVPASGWLVLLSRGLEGLAFAVLAISGPVLANASAKPSELPIVIGFTAAWVPVGQLAATLLAPLAFWVGAWQLLWLVAIAGTLAFAVWTLPLGKAGLLASRHRAAGPDPAKTQAAGPSRGQVRSLILTGAIFMLWSCQYFAYMTWLPQYLVEVHGLVPSSALAGYVLPVFMVMVMCIATGALLRAGVSLRWLLISALVSQALVWALLPWTSGASLGVASLTVYGIGAGIVPSCLFAMPSTILRGGHDTARAFAIVMTGRNLGVLAGPVLLAQAFVWAGSWDLAAPIFTTITAATLPPAIILAFRR